MRMLSRTVFAVVVVSFFSSSALPAQPTSLTFRGGLNLSDFVGDDFGDTRSETGLNLGAAFSPVSFGPASAVVEVYYREKGAEGASSFQPGDPVPTAVEIGLDYVEIPLLLRVDLPSGLRWLRPYVQGGPAFGWRIDCGVSVDTQTGQADESCDDLFGEGQLEETLEDYEQGIVLGGGLDFVVLGGLGAINVDARYTRGLSRLSTFDSGPDVKNESFTAMLGYSFNLGGSSWSGLGR